MTVFALMPVHNRLSATRAMVYMLRAQKIDQPLRIVVIDDGSSDGTAEWLAGQADLTVITGDGSLWWGGSIHKGFVFCDREGVGSDWVLLVNDDTEITPDFVMNLLAVARANPDSIVGAMLRHIDPPHALISIAPVIDNDRLVVADWSLTKEAVRVIEKADYLPAEALSGRGVIYPLVVLRELNGMRPRVLPHYLADYELSLRARRRGWRLLVATKTAVYTREDWGNQNRLAGWKQKFFSCRSPSYLPAMIAFWWQADTPSKRFSLPYRVALRLLRKSR